MPEDAESTEAAPYRISEGTAVYGKAASFLHDEENGEVEEIQERGRVAVRWDSAYANYSLCSFIGLLREGYFEVKRRAE